MKFKFSATEIPDVVIIEPNVYGDSRGFFMESWNLRDFSIGGINVDFVQENHSASQQGVLRGLHYQIKQPQGKLVRVISGEVFDVAIDLRKSSATFGKWVGFSLSSENKKLAWIPAGFAHGFYVKSNSAEFLYNCTDYYAPEFERSIVWNDPDLMINWPLIDGALPRLNQKDSSGGRFKNADYFP